MEKELREVIRLAIIETIDSGTDKRAEDILFKNIKTFISNRFEREVMPKIAEEIKPNFDYDDIADVMYISFGKPQKCKSEEIGDGSSKRITLDGKLNGFTIADYSKRVGEFSNFTV